MRISQVELISAIGKNIARQAKARGLPEPGALPRQVNAIIEAANLVVDAYAQDYTEAKSGSGITGWLRSDDRGRSSEAMLAHLGPLATGQYWVDVPADARDAHPHDPSDLGRCVKLLDAAPELRPHHPRMAELSATWARLVAAWDELESLYREELPTGSAPRCFRRMRDIIGSA